MNKCIIISSSIITYEKFGLYNSSILHIMQHFYKILNFFNYMDFFQRIPFFGKPCITKFTIRTIVCEASWHPVSCHPVIWSLGHLVTRSLGHSVIRSLGHLVTWSLGHLVTQSLVTSSLGHLVTRSLCLLVTQSIGHYSFIFNVATN